MVKGYCTIDDIERYLDRRLTADQIVQAEALREPAEGWIDDRTGRAWLSGSSVTEWHARPDGPLLWLRKTPVTSITSLTAYSGATVTTGTVLIANDTYYIRDLTQGLLYLPGWTGIDRLQAVYLPTSVAVPATVRLAAAMLVGWWLRPYLAGGDVAGVASYSVGGELSVSYTDLSRQQGVPGEVLTLLPSVSAGMVLT